MIINYDEHHCNYCSAPENDCGFPDCMSLADRKENARQLVREAFMLDKEAAAIEAQIQDIKGCI